MEAQVKFNYNLDEYESDITFDREDLWNIDLVLASVIAPALEKYKDTAGTYVPVDENDAPQDATDRERWEWALGEMIFAFRQIEAAEGQGLNDLTEERVQRGLNLFGKYYQGLWT